MADELTKGTTGGLTEDQAAAKLAEMGLKPVFSEEPSGVDEPGPKGNPPPPPETTAETTGDEEPDFSDQLADIAGWASRMKRVNNGALFGIFKQLQSAALQADAHLAKIRDSVDAASDKAKSDD